MASYLLQEDGGKLELEDGSGFVLLEDGTVPPLAPKVGPAPGIIQQRPRRSEEEEAILVAAAIGSRRRRWVVR